MIKKVPLAAVQAAMYKTLSEHIVGYNVYDDSTPYNEGELPDEKFLVIGENNCRPMTAKVDSPRWEVSSTIHAFSKYEGKKEINGMAEDVVEVLTTLFEYNRIDIEDYYLEDLDVDIVEAFKEEYEDGTRWQHGVIKVLLKVEQKVM